MSHQARNHARGTRVALTRASAAGMKDSDLVAAMSARDPIAWGEWDRRFRLVLEQYARQAGIPRWNAGVCAAEVLEKEGMALAFGGRRMPSSLAAYLRTAVPQLSSSPLSMRS